jgi:hypothetical protein
MGWPQTDTIKLATKLFYLCHVCSHAKRSENVRKPGPLARFFLEGLPKLSDLCHVCSCVDLPRGQQMLPIRACWHVSFSRNFLNLQTCILSVHTGSHVHFPTMLAKRFTEDGKDCQMPTEIGTRTDLGLTSCQPRLAFWGHKPLFKVTYEFVQDLAGVDTLWRKN